MVERPLYAVVDYEAEIGDSVFAVPFPYIDKAHVHVYVNEYPENHTWLADNSIKLNNPLLVPAIVRVKRHTPLDRRLVDFQSASVLTEKDLDVSALQVFFNQQEVEDDLQLGLLGYDGTNLKGDNGNYIEQRFQWATSAPTTPVEFDPQPFGWLPAIPEEPTSTDPEVRYHLWMTQCWKNGSTGQCETVWSRPVRLTGNDAERLDLKDGWIKREHFEEQLSAELQLDMDALNAATGQAEAARDAAQLAETNATASETAAEAAVVNANDALNGAIAAKDDAITQAGLAEQAKGAAVTAETDAEGHAAAALASKNTAQNYEAQSRANAEAAALAETNADGSAQAALTAETNAQQWAAQTSTDSQAAVTAKTDAEGHAAAALASKTDAEASASAAATSATNAEGDAAAALTAKTDAETASQAAVTAKTDAEGHASAALTAKTDAETASQAAVTAETNAEGHAAAALTAKGDAETASQAAVTAKTDAEGHAAAALTSKNDADASAIAAAQSATDADGNASAALVAQTNAENAATSAVTAETNAEGHATAALTAQSSAENAETGATNQANIAIQAAADADESASLVTQVSLVQGIMMDSWTGSIALAQGTGTTDAPFKQMLTADSFGKTALRIQITDAGGGISVGWNGVEIDAGLTGTANETKWFEYVVDSDYGDNEVSIWSDGVDTATVKALELRGGDQDVKFSGVESRLSATENESLYSIKVQQDGKVAGFGMLADPTGTAILFQADQIGFTDNANAEVYPFSIRDGVVYMDKARLVTLEANSIVNVESVYTTEKRAQLGNTAIEGTFNLQIDEQILWKDLHSSFRDRLILRAVDASITGGTRSKSALPAVGLNLYAAKVNDTDYPVINSGGQSTDVTIHASGGVGIGEGRTTPVTAPSITAIAKRKKVSTGAIENLGTVTLTGTTKSEDTTPTTYWSRLDKQEVISTTLPTSGEDYEYWLEVTQKSGDWGSGGGTVTLEVVEEVGSSDGIVTNTNWDAVQYKPQIITDIGEGIAIPMEAELKNGYYGIKHPDGSTSNWQRTTSNGIIPYQAGGHGSLGTSSWFFEWVYSKRFSLDTGTKIYAGFNGSARIESSFGYVEVAPQNSDWCHFTTDKLKYYFSRDMHVNGEIRTHQGDAYLKGDNVYAHEGYFTQNGNQLYLKDGEGDIKPTCILRNDGSYMYFLVSDPSSGVNAAWNALRPLNFSLTSGLLKSHNGQEFYGGTSIRADLTVTGLASANDFRATSDRRVKENLNVIENALEKVDLLTGYTYDHTQLKQRHAGIIAQDAQKALPEAVGSTGKGDDELLNVSPTAMIALLTNAVKELKQELNDAVTEIKELKDVIYGDT